MYSRIAKMTCPDLSDLARVGTPRADPAVVEHLQQCHSCWLDWQIQQGARYLHTGVRNDPQDLNQKVMVGITEMARQSDRPAGWGQLSLFGFLIAVALLIFFFMRMGATAPVLLAMWQSMRSQALSPPSCTAGSEIGKRTVPRDR